MKIIYACLVLLGILSCKQLEKQSIKTIKVDPNKSDQIGISKIASRIDKIILQTNDSCLITRIQEIKKTTHYIFINDAGQRILQFDSFGNFIKQIGKGGRGPGEYLGINSFTLDSINQTIYVSSLRNIICFDYFGNPIREIRQESFSESMNVIGDELWTISTSYGNKQNGLTFFNITKLVRYTLQGNPVDTIIIKKVSLPGLSGTINPSANYISDLGYIRYLYFPVLILEPIQIVRDTIYEVKSDKIIPSLKLDFGKDAIPENGRIPIRINCIYLTGKYLFIEYTRSREKFLLCFNLKNNDYYNMPEGFIDDYYNTGYTWLKPLDLKKGILYFSKDAFMIYDKIEGISENSNPILFIVSLK